jgi:integrase
MSCVGVPVCRRRTVPNKQKLTSLTVTKLRPTAKPYLVWDSYQRGLALQIRPSGYRAYKLIYRFHNRPRWFHIGAADAIALANARKLAAELMLEVIRGKDPAAERRAERGAGTFAELAERYVEEHAKKHNRSWAHADYLVRKNLLPAWGKLGAADVGRADVKAMLAHIASRSVANQTLAAASAIFSWAIREEVGGVTVNPCSKVRRNQTRSRERVLADSEVPLFWAAFDHAGLVASSALKIILLTGQRPGEVWHMRREHISDGWWTMPGKPDPNTGWPGTKNGQTHRVWLPAETQAIIAELSDGEEPTGRVFDRGRQMMDVAMRSICRTLSAERATPHDLRRTHGSTITKLGFGRDAMNRIQNHKEGGIGDVYDRHEYAAENKRVMESTATHLLALAQGNAAPSNVVRAKF